MRFIGVVALLVGVLWIGLALAMDTSVSTGIGSRVNNIGLIAAQQNHIAIGGLIVLVGILLVVFGRKAAPPTEAFSVTGDERPCPLCAEPIKRAAIKCKHCGSDIEPAPEAPAGAAMSTAVTIATESGPPHRVSFPSVAGSERVKIAEALQALSLPVINETGRPLAIGPYPGKKSAADASGLVARSIRIYGKLERSD